MSAHTPGPWVVENRTETVLKFVLRVTSDELDIDIADLNCDWSDAEAVAATLADANLIAAAPDLFAAVVLGWSSSDDSGRAFLCNCPRWGVLAQNASKDRDEDHSTQCRAVRGAIAKVRGGK